MRFAFAPLFALLVATPSELVSAGEFDRSTLPAAAADPAHCDSQSEGPAKESGDCKRISGYVAAGARFRTDEQTGGHPPRSVRSTRRNSSAACALRARRSSSAPAGLDRFSRSPGSGDEAR